jgi:Tfp pilus assembly protein PilN
MRFTINLATRIYLDHRKINNLAYCSIAVLFIVAIWNVSRVASLMGEQSRLDKEIATIQGKIGTKPSGVSEAESTLQKAHIRFYNKIIERISINWLSKLDMFEDVTPEGISLATLTPDKKPGEWKLIGRARSFKAVQRYLEKLETSKNFSNVMLLSHQNISAGEFARGVQFTISCKVLN